MRSFKTLSVVLALTLVASTATLFAADYKVDSAHSFLMFKVRHFNAGNVYGRFNNPTGKLVYDASDVSKSTFEVEARTDALDTGNAMRDKHLKTPDFFDAAQNPTLSFKSTKVEKGEGDDDLKITGDLTIHGETKSITVDAKTLGEAKDPQGKTRIGFETKFTIKRSDYGMNFMAGAVGDDIELTVALEGVKQ